MDNFFNQNKELTSSYYNTHFSKVGNYVDAYVKLHNEIRTASEDVVNQLFGSKTGFSYGIDPIKDSLTANSDDITPAVILEYIISKSSAKYKINVEDGHVSCASLFFRGTRNHFLELLKAKLESVSWGYRARFQTKKDSDGGNPRLIATILFSRKFIQKGKEVIKEKAMNFEFYLKYSSAKQKVNYTNMLKPSGLGVVDKWMSYKEMYMTLIRFIRSSDFPFKTFPEITASYLDAVKKSIEPNNLTAPIRTNISGDMPSEFLEILSSIKVAKLLSMNDSKIKETLGVIDTVNKEEVYIYIPSQANFALVDYFISTNGIPKRAGEYGGIRISVKSNLRGNITNTVKFGTIFKNESEVDAWYNSLNDRYKITQVAQRRTAASSTRAGRGKGTNFGIVALYDILNENNATGKRMKQDMLYFFYGASRFGLASKQYDTFISCLGKIADSVNSVVKAEEISKLRRLSDDDKIFIGQFFDELVEKNKARFKYFIKPDKRNMVYFAYMCDKVLELASQKTSRSRTNYYKLFYDNVLCSGKNQAILGYAVFKHSEDTNGNTVMNYGLYSKINFKNEYKKWIALRSKDTPGDEALGMAV
jgi:hypothetical protein